MWGKGQFWGEPVKMPQLGYFLRQRFEIFYAYSLLGTLLYVFRFFENSRKKIKKFENSKFCFLKKVYMPKNATKKFQIIFFHCLLSLCMFPNKKMYSISDGFSMAGAITMPFTFYEKSDLGSAFHSQMALESADFDQNFTKCAQ